MNWLVAAFVAALGVALVAWRNPAAHWEGMAMGARLPVGCAVAQGVVLLIIAVCILLLRPYG